MICEAIGYGLGRREGVDQDFGAIGPIKGSIRPMFPLDKGIWRTPDLSTRFIPTLRSQLK